MREKYIWIAITIHCTSQHQHICSPYTSCTPISQKNTFVHTCLLHKYISASSLAVCRASSNKNYLHLQWVKSVHYLDPPLRRWYRFGSWIFTSVFFANLTKSWQEGKNRSRLLNALGSPFFSFHISMYFRTHSSERKLL